jgi:hypothetical protein
MPRHEVLNLRDRHFSRNRVLGEWRNVGWRTSTLLNEWTREVGSQCNAIPAGVKTWNLWNPQIVRVCDGCPNSVEMWAVNFKILVFVSSYIPPKRNRKILLSALHNYMCLRFYVQLFFWRYAIVHIKFNSTQYLNQYSLRKESSLKQI